MNTDLSADLPRDDARDPLRTLTTKQRQLFEAIENYCHVTREACPGTYLARRFSLHHSTVQKHISVLHRKGWLRSPNAPALPTDF